MESPDKTQAQQWLGLSLLVLPALLWGTVGVSIRWLYGLADTNALSIGFWRMGIAAPLLLGSAYWLVGKRFWQVQGSHLWLMLLHGGMMALYQVCTFAAIGRVGVAVAILLALCLAPVVVAILSSFWLRERLTATVAMAGGLAVLGSALLVNVPPTSLHLGGEFALGVGLACAAAFCYAVVVLVSRLLAQHYHPLHTLSISFSLSAVILLPFALATQLVVSYSPLGWGVLVYLGVITTVVAYGLFLSGIRYATATVASVVTLLEPLMATLLAWLFFAEQLSQKGWIGALLLLLAVVLLYQPSASQARSS
ncbi:MAG: EamA family transporter [Cyanobacteriota bacterium]|nr:EamA family transporter [Cyanobacteriota bacterium]